MADECDTDGVTHVFRVCLSINGAPHFLSLRPMSSWSAFVLLHILCAVAAIPLQSDTTQAAFSSNLVAWYDPRTNGGRLLDVR
jgi:hypothetical protein